jgi:hypothetical protein
MDRPLSQRIFNLLDGLEGCFVVIEGQDTEQRVILRRPLLQHCRSVILWNPDSEPHLFAARGKQRLYPGGFADGLGLVGCFRVLLRVVVFGHRHSNDLVLATDPLPQEPAIFFIIDRVELF